MIWILAPITFITSIISAIAGMGGGVMLLSLMTFFAPYHIIIPLHGIVQFVSNSSRAFYLRHHIKKDFFFFFLAGTPIGFLIAYFVLSKISDPGFYNFMLAAFILFTLFKPKKLPQFKLKGYQWTILGIAATVQGSIMGASGPLIAPFYIRDDLAKEQIIATKAMQQLVIHFLKIPLFLSLNFSYFEYKAIIIAMCISSILGSFVGVRFLKNMNQEVFQRIFKTVLFLTAMRLIFKFIEGQL